LAIILALVLYPGTLGAHGLHHPASVTAGGAPAATTVGVVATVVPFLQPYQPAEIFCHDSARAPGKDGSGGRWSKCALCPVLCGGAGPPALLPPEGAPPLHRSTATRRHGPPPRTAVVVTRPRPVTSGGGSRAPPPDS
ncbi:MAG TPA: hypothetical protein VFG47_03940, partial [Geminicoccaceae bacterium]|nr:hypothetical protein [Geminicoccaceae bacterium]